MFIDCNREISRKDISHFSFQGLLDTMRRLWSAYLLLSLWRNPRARAYPSLEPPGLCPGIPLVARFSSVFPRLAGFAGLLLPLRPAVRVGLPTRKLPLVCLPMRLYGECGDCVVNRVAGVW